MHEQTKAPQHCSPEEKRSGEHKMATFHPMRSETIYVQPAANTGTVSRETEERWQLRDETDREWTFPSSTMPS